MGIYAYSCFFRKILTPKGDCLVHNISILMSGSLVILQASYGFHIVKTSCKAKQMQTSTDKYKGSLLCDIISSKI